MYVYVEDWGLGWWRW